MRLFDRTPGDAPVVLSFPHAGTFVPGDVAARMTAIGRTSIDTDWNVDRLYPFAERLGIATLRANVSRYVVDLNRDPHGTPLYPGARTSGLAPVETFEGDALYAAGDEPGAREIAARVETYWTPYHDALAAELARARERHGYAVLVDGHSIWGRLPLLFAGELPDVNLGTHRGASCSREIVSTVADVLREAYPSLVVDGRFTGGYITRSYGAPAQNVHAIQIELNQRTYLADGSRTVTDEAKARTLAAALEAACERLVTRHVPA